MDKIKILQGVKDRLEKMSSERIEEKKQADEERKNLITIIGKDISEYLRPYLQEASRGAQMSKQAIHEAIADAIANIQVNVPETKIPDFPKMPEFKIPTPQVTVNVPKADPPNVTVKPADVSFPSSMAIHGFDNKRPLPVQMFDQGGKPMQFPVSMGGGKSDFFTIVDVKGSTASIIDQIDGAMKVVGSLSTTPFATYYASDAISSVNVVQSITLETLQLSGAIDSVYITGAAASTYAELLNPDGRVKVELPTGTSGLTDAEIRASALPVSQVSGAAWSTEVTNTVTVSATNLDIRDLDNNTDSIRAYQLSGAVDSVFVTGFIDSTVVYNARQTNPTAVADGADVRPSADDLGRALTRMQARDLTLTAYVSVSNGTETTLRAAVAGAYLDLIHVIGTNNSDAAVSVDLRAVTAGNIQTTIRIPANGTAGASFSHPLPSDETGNNWTADLPDITGTTVTLSALFSRET